MDWVALAVPVAGAAVVLAAAALAAVALAAVGKNYSSPYLLQGDACDVYAII